MLLFGFLGEMGGLIPEAIRIPVNATAYLILNAIFLLIPCIFCIVPLWLSLIHI